MSDIKTSYTRDEIAQLMLKGGLYGLIAVSIPIVFMIVIWIIGGFLPAEARSEVSSLLTMLPTLA
ncbi:MAG: hypothetical protein AAFQ36_05615 [Pseudomonadota bacterium]